MYIKLDDIIPNRFQPREVFDEEALNKLAESIKQHGVIEPILVRPVANKYEIVAGERRYKASVLAGLTKIPAMVRQLDDRESSIIAFIENEHRSDVSAIEEARTMDRILKSNNITQEELAKELGVNQSTIANKIRLLNLPLEVQEALMRNEISERHARSLLTVKDEEKQLELLKRIKERKMTVRELDSEIKEMNNMNDNMNNIYGDNPVDNNTISGSTMFNEYLNNPPSQETTPTPPIATGFMDFLNNYDNNTVQKPITPVTPVEPVVENMVPLQETNTFTPITSSELEMPNYMDYVNNTQVNIPPIDTPSVEKNVQDNNPYNDFLNNISTINNVEEKPMPPMAENETEDPGFMEFLNNYDLNNPLPKEEPVEEVSVTPVQQEPVNNDYMSLLNNINNNPLPKVDNTPIVTPPVENNTISNTNDYSFLNNFNEEKQEPIEPVVPEEKPVENFDENIYTNYQEPANNVYINDVNPPITTDFSNQYVEDNPNYVDVSKEVVIDNVDEIINRLKNVIDDIKATSKFKVDTDEINYDDIYQITIKIDKRDF